MEFSYNEQEVIDSLKQSKSELDKDIGRSVKYRTVTCGIENETFIIRHIQTNYKGELCYNLVPITGETVGTPSGEFGRCCNPSQVYFN